jgi:hypothetical protein
MLSRIAPETYIKIRLLIVRSGGHEEHFGYLVEVRELDNAVAFAKWDGTGGDFVFPLDQVQSVWKDIQGEWNISVRYQG